jgi:hypothetical protein
MQLPPDVAPGPHQIVLVVDGPRSEQPQTWTMDDWPVHDAALVDPNFTMRREESSIGALRCSCKLRRMDAQVLLNFKVHAINFRQES